MKESNIAGKVISRPILLAVAVMVFTYFAAFGVYVLTGFNLISYYDIQTPLFVISVDMSTCPGGGPEYPSQCLEYAPAFAFFLFLYFVAGFSAIYFHLLKRSGLSVYGVTSMELKTVLIGTFVTGLLDLFLHNFLLSPSSAGFLGEFSDLSKYGIGYVVIYISAASFGIIPALAGGFLSRYLTKSKGDPNSQDAKNSNQLITYLTTCVLIFIAWIWAFLLVINYMSGM